jgi:hypothetical protein
MDVYAAVGALVRAEIARAHVPSTDASALKATSHTDQVAPPASVPSPTKAARRSRKLLVVALRRLAALFG